ncbi:hypothetical protein SAMN05216327_102170 [Dyadobacter sp. SG02]|uniref:hypothetical protein n=1 Tax=Dyadobacter sp. SG02 TaxID=1855291 RepID=UPI0008CAE0C8|nr:hypothetical protein [Dyadobacter sp. SG02]SEI51755.1 hypothetical protein SAMN05216327_102170 [Dyadobacter sp. SG02]
MSTWGTSIASNDTYADVRKDFFDLYDEGVGVEEISRRLVIGYQETIHDNGDCHNFWFALAKAQWECKQLDGELFERIRTIIESGADLKIWKELGSNEKDLKRRENALDKFLVELQSERPKAKSRKKALIRQALYEKGDCLTFKLENGNYGGVVVLESINDSEYGYNLIAATRINQPSRPTKIDFENSDVLVLNHADWADKVHVVWYLPARHRRIAHLIEKVENIEVQAKFDMENSVYGSVSDFEVWILQTINRQLKSEEKKPRSLVKQTIKELSKRKKWKFW